MKIGKSYFEDVCLWEHELFNSVEPYPPILPSSTRTDKYELAMRLITEEYQELKDAFEKRDYKGIVDGGGDLIWVVCGMLAKLGIDLDAAWEEIRRSNWDKKNGPRRTDGKLLKPPGWVPPDFNYAVKSGRNLMDIVNGKSHPK